MFTSIFSRSESLALIQDIKSMPTLPDRFFKINALIADPCSDSSDLSKIIETDLATSAMLLKIANSTSYNPHGNLLSSLPHAIARLGVSTSAEIAMSMALLQKITTTKSIHNIHALWAHSYATAMICKYMCQRLKTPLESNISTVFMMGLLHDIGQVVLAISVDQSYFDRNLPTMHSEALCHAEQALYGIDHAEAGSIILSNWNMPDILIQSTLCHHKPSGDATHALCSLAELFVATHWPNLQHIEEVHQLLCYSPIDKIDVILQTSPILQKHLK